MRLAGVLGEGWNDESEYDDGSRSQAISKDKFFDLLMENCMDAYNTDEIYRGVKSAGGDYLYINPKRYERVSRFTANWYILLMRLMSSWRKYPDLGRSLIASTSYDGACGWSDEDNIFRVLPYNGAKLGITPGVHFWSSFDDIGGMSDLTRFLSGIVESLDLVLDYRETNKKVLLDIMKKVDKRRDELMDGKEFNETYDIYGGPLMRYYDDYKSGMIGTLLDLFEKVLNPNEFRVETIGDDLPSGKQVWTEAECIMIRAGYTHELDKVRWT